jgi:hypothetical protein
MAAGVEHKLLLARSSVLTIIRTMRRPGAGVPLRAASVAAVAVPLWSSPGYKSALRS